MRSCLINVEVPKNSFDLDKFLKELDPFIYYEKHKYKVKVNDGSYFYLVKFTSDLTIIYSFKSNGDFDFLKFSTDSKFYLSELKDYE